MIHPLTRVVLTKLASARCLLLTAFCSLSPLSRSGYCPGASMIRPLTQVVLTKAASCSLLTAHCLLFSEPSLTVGLLPRCVNDSPADASGTDKSGVLLAAYCSLPSVL